MRQSSSKEIIPESRSRVSLILIFVIFADLCRSGRGNWQNWGQWATRNYTWPMATSTVNAKPVETPVELPSVAAPAEDARPTTTRAARPRPTAVKTTSVKPTSVKPTSAKPKPTSVKPTTTRKPQNTTRSSSSSTSQKPVETSPASGNLSAFAQAAVSGHNAERKLHGADPVVWDEALAKEAQKWTDRCVFEHGTSSLSFYQIDLML